MNHSRSIFAARVISGALVACTAVMAGCIASSEPEATIDSAEETRIYESGALPVPAQGELRLERTSEGEDLTLAPNGAWRELAPGVFEGETEGGSSRIVVGAEGHAWAVEQAEKDLEGLYERSSLQPDSEPAAIEAIERGEANLKNLKKAAQDIAAMKAGTSTPQAVSCNISFYNGPSSPFTGYYGAAGLAQVSCSGGCQTFTIAAQACSNLGCTPVNTAQSFVCSSPWLFGMAKSGTYGAACSSAASVSPPGVTGSGSYTCG